MKHVPPKHNRTAPRSWMSLFWANRGAFSVIAALVSVVVTLISIFAYQSAAQFERIGVVAEAQVIARRVDRSGDDDDYYITFRFDADQQTVTRESEVSRSYHRRVAPGETVDIRYLPHDPHEFETYVGEKRDNAVMAQVMAGVAGLVSLVALWFLGGKVNKAVLTRRLGYRAVAKVSRVVETKNSGRPSGNGYMQWRTADGVTGESLTHKIGKLRAIGVGAEINVYVRKGYSVWEGDVGPQHEVESNLPKVPRT